MSSRKKTRKPARARPAERPGAARRPRPPAQTGPLSDDVTAALRAGLERSRPAPPTGGRRHTRPSDPAAPDVPAGDRAAAPSAPAGTVEVRRWSCAAVEDAEPHGLSMSHWVEVPSTPASERLTVRFAGRGVGPGNRTTFERDVAVGPLPPGVGRVAVTGRVSGIPAGEYEVSAVVLEGVAGTPSRAGAVGRGHTSFGPLARVLAPGVRPFAWPGFVLIGTVLALGVQLALGRSRGLPSGTVLALTLLACVVGVAGAKAYYLLTHRGRPGGVLASGMSVQGFVLASIGTLALGSVTADVPVGDVLDVTTPGLLAGMAVGRLGCLLGGCCAGRPTRSRWGLWSSDRVLGARRIPVQLLEGAAAALLSATAALLVATSTLTGGRAFVAGLAGYTLARQLLFPLRDIPRTTRWGRPAMIMLTAALVVAAVGTA